MYFNCSFDKRIERRINTKQVFIRLILLKFVLVPNCSF